MTVKINKPAINLREELASLRNQGGLPKEDKLYLDDLVTNGDFSNGLSGWTAANCTLSISSGALAITSTSAATGQAMSSFPTVKGKTYALSFESKNGTGLQVDVILGSSVGNADLTNTTNYTGTTFTITRTTFVATGDTTYIALRSFVTGSGQINYFDNVSVQEVGENLVTNGTFDTGTTGWTTIGNATTSVSNGELTISGDGGYNDGIEQIFNTTMGDVYSVTVKGRSITGAVTILVRDYGGSYSTLTSHNFTSTSNETVTLTFTAISSQCFVQLLQWSGSSGSGVFDNITVTEGNHNVIQSIPYGYDVKDVYIDGELAREGEAYDYEVKTDGINQWLKPTVEPTATTETVVIGVRK
jgi:hypothetical protein